jgi:hypothetical protein
MNAVRYEQQLERWRVTKPAILRLQVYGGKFVATGFALNDGTPLRPVEIRLDNPSTMCLSWR